jgi:hypothetical protein
LKIQKVPSENIILKISKQKKRKKTDLILFLLPLVFLHRPTGGRRGGNQIWCSLLLLSAIFSQRLLSTLKKRRKLDLLPFFLLPDSENRYFESGLSEYRHSEDECYENRYS